MGSQEWDQDAPADVLLFKAKVVSGLSEGALGNPEPKQTSPAQVFG